MNNLYVNTIKKYLYIYIVLIIEPYSSVTDDILCVWTFGLPGLYNVIKIIIIIIIIIIIYYYFPKYNSYCHQQYNRYIQ